MRFEGHSQRRITKSPYKKWNQGDILKGEIVDFDRITGKRKQGAFEYTVLVLKDQQGTIHKVKCISAIESAILNALAIVINETGECEIDKMLEVCDEIEFTCTAKNKSVCEFDVVIDKPDEAKTRQQKRKVS